jgi:hypothetical protein
MSDDIIAQLRDKVHLRKRFGITGWLLAEEALRAKVADEIKRLRAERVDWARRFKLNDVTPWEWMTRATNAEAERDALLADAERYRWLRDRHSNSLIWLEVGGDDLMESALDAAIDAALAAAKTQSPDSPPKA